MLVKTTNFDIYSLVLCSPSLMFDSGETTWNPTRKHAVIATAFAFAAWYFTIRVNDRNHPFIKGSGVTPGMIFAHYFLFSFTTVKAETIL